MHIYIYSGILCNLESLRKNFNDQRNKPHSTPISPPCSKQTQLAMKLACEVLELAERNPLVTYSLEILYNPLSWQSISCAARRLATLLVINVARGMPQVEQSQ